MTTSPHDQQPAGNNSNRQTVDEQSEERTPANLLHETLPVEQLEQTSATSQHRDLPTDLSPDERARAAQALDFLDDVRFASQESGQLPHSIGRYSIERTLGRGGFAEVFLAYDPELDRKVALKVPLFNTALNDEVRQRFEREARLAATLGHPQIIPVFEYGIVGPLRYIAFAWCNGSTLSTWMADNAPADFRTSAEIICHLADAVQHAHQRGIVHRDLKPGNVLIEDTRTSDGEREPVWDRVRITDFGLARSSESDATVLTQDGRIIGTPAYMSPEQASSQRDVGPAADIWALGMMLFEMLTNELPFRRNHMLATVRAITDESVPRARSVRSEVPAGLEAIADLCLRKSPSDRYKSAHELAADLRRWLNGEPVYARSMSPVSKVALWVRRNPLLSTSVALTFAALGIGLSIALWQRNEAMAHLQEVQAQTTRANGNLQTAQTLISDIIALEKRLHSQGQLSKERAALIRRAAKLQTQLIKDEQQTPRVRFDTAIALQELASLLSQLQQFDESTEVARQVLTLLDGIGDEFPDGVTPAKLFEIRIQQQIKIASNLSITNRFDDAALVYDAADSEPVPEDVNPLQRATWLSEMRRGRAMMLAMNGDRASSAEEQERGLNYFRGIEPPHDRKQRWNYFLCQSRLHTGLGMDQMSLQEVDLALGSFAQAAAELVELAEIFPDHPTLANQQMQLSYHRGALAEQTSDWQAACEHYETSRQTALGFASLNRENLMPPNFYVMTSVSLCRAHDRNGSPNAACKVALETIEAAQSFPSSLQNTQAFSDNLKILESKLQPPEEFVN